MTRDGRGSLLVAGAAAAGLGAAHAAGNARLLRRPPRAATTTRSVALLVPARDEQADIAACVRTLTAQRGLAGGMELLVLDDGSGDATARLAAAAGARVLTGARLPPGWLGKPHACAQLADATRAELLVFLDADVRLSPDAVAGAIALLEGTGLDYLSPYPRQVAIGMAERLVQPLLAWSWLTLLPLRVAERSGHPSLAVANGQFLLVRRSAYERAGGHGAVRAEVLEDLALARALCRSGARGGVVDGAQLASCRMYRGMTAVRAGYGKSLGVAVGGSRVASLAMAVTMLVGWTLPWIVAGRRGSRIGWFGYLAGVAGRVIAARTAGARVWPDVLAHPLSVAAAAALTLESAMRRDRIRWRGRPL